MHFRMMLHRIFRKIKIKELFRTVSTLVLAVALCFSSTAISVYATAIVPIGSEIISQATDFGVAEYVFNLLRNGYTIDFENYSLQWEDFINDWKDEGLVKASIDKFIDTLQGVEYGTAYYKNVDFLSGINRELLNKALENNTTTDIPIQSIELTPVQLELLKGAYNLNNQSLVSINWNYGSKDGHIIYNAASKLVPTCYGTSMLWLADASSYDNVWYFIDSDDYSISLYNGNSVISNNSLPTYQYNSNWMMQGFTFIRYGSPNYDTYLSLIMAESNTYNASYQPGNFQNYVNKFWSQYGLGNSYNNYRVMKNLNNALMALWGSKNIPIYYGSTTQNMVLLENPFVEGYFFDGGFALTPSGNNPLVANYPEGSIIDLISLISSIKTAISNKTKLDLSDIEDLIVDINGQRAVATYEIIRNDYDVLSQEIFAPYELIVSPDPEYMEAYGSGLETAGNIINNTVSVIPEDISLFLFGGAFVLLIILVLRRGSE